MIKTEYKELLKILSCFLHQEEYISAENYDLVEIRRIAAQHSISGIVGYILRKGMDDWAKDYYATCGETVQRIDAFNSLEKDLDVNKIPHLMVKGFVVRKCYPVPQLRTFGDLDIIIRPEDRNRSHELMRNLGYVCEEDWEPSYSYRKNNEFYEFQTELLDKNPIDNVDFKSFFSNPWKYAVKTGEYRYQLDPDFAFLYILVHLAKHVSVSGAGLRMYLDVAVLIQKNEVNWDRVLAFIQELRMEKFFCTILSAIEKWYGVVPPIPYKKVDGKLLDELLIFTIEGGTFGFHGEDISTMMLRKSTGGKIGLLIRTAFPPVETISARYTYLKKRPWLLPVAWVHRAYLNRGKIKEEQKLLKDIVSSNAGKVEHIKRMYSDIGL